MTTESTVLFKPPPPPPLGPYYLDVNAFSAALEKALLIDGVAGFVYQLRQSGQTLVNNPLEYAKREQDGLEWWTADVQMHVASVSKLMTAMAMMVLFRDHKISNPPWDVPIIDYLPGYWQKGSNIEYITFLNLFQHTSGLGLSVPDLVDFQSMKSAIAAGIKPGNLGQYHYRNLNYALCRILLPVINGDINKDTNYGWLNDSIWDQLTIIAYEKYLQAKVFQPSSVVGATLDHPHACALAYRGPDDTKPGWNSGNMQESCGGDGWHLSVNQLLDVMGEFRRGGGILTPAAAQAMLDNGFGVDPFTGGPLPTAKPTPAGNVYYKPGDWHDGNDECPPDEQSLAFFLPEDMELVVFVNSTVGGLTGENNSHFRDLVMQAYLDNLITKPDAHP
jgi:CubicO group peptidase (beta-lactamase class C family)